MQQRMAGSDGEVLQQENAGKPEGLPPSQGGKYVGFGSGGAAPSAGVRRGNAAGAAGLDDVSQALSKGFMQACSVAGAALLPSTAIPGFNPDACGPCRADGHDKSQAHAA